MEVISPCSSLLLVLSDFPFMNFKYYYKNFEGPEMVSKLSESGYYF
jgi:hypothetical protein